METSIGKVVAIGYV